MTLNALVRPTGKDNPCAEIVVYEEGGKEVLTVPLSAERAANISRILMEEVLRLAQFK